MTYEQFLKLQSRLEWLTDFHPGYLGELKKDHAHTLRQWFLLDVPDDDYPKSLRLFYAQQIVPFPNRQTEMVDAMAELYRVSGSGNLFQDFNFKPHVTS